MSTSRSRDTVELKIEGPDAASEIFLIDPKLERIAAGVGRLEAAVSPGLYKVRVRSGDAMRDRLVEVKGGKEPVTLTEDSLAFETPAPLVDTLTATEAQREAARGLSQAAAIPNEGDASLFVFIHGRGRIPPDARATIRDADGAMVCEIAERGGFKGEGEWASGSVCVAPGTYSLRIDTGRAGTYETFLAACAGWQTQAFLAVERHEDNQTTVQRPALRSASVLMSRPEVGFDPASASARLAELARAGVVGGRDVIRRDVLERHLSGEEENPMLCLYAGHQLLREHRIDRALLGRVCDRLEAITGAHPDVCALALKLESSGRDARPFDAPPMLRASWDLIVRANRRAAGLVEQGSLIDRVSDGLVRAGPWVLRRLPEEQATPAIATPPTHKLSNAQLNGWLKDLVAHTVRASNELDRASLPKDRFREISPLDKNVLRSIESQIFQSALRTPEPKFIEKGLVPARLLDVDKMKRHLSSALDVPPVSVGRSIQRLASSFEPGDLGFGFDETKKG